MYRIRLPPITIGFLQPRLWRRGDTAHRFTDSDCERGGDQPVKMGVPRPSLRPILGAAANLIERGAAA